MLKKDRAAFIRHRLDQLYPNPPIPLVHQDAFTLLVAVLLSAQCTDERVNQVTPRLFALADNARAMSEVSQQQVYDIIRPCGLAPQKSKAIVNLSKILVDQYNGEVPEDIAALETLPGVGHKTASVVISQAFGHPAFPVDTHIHRLAQRWGLSNGNSVVQTEKDLKRLFPRNSWNALHLQIIYYGREHCSARSCNGLSCDICKTCFPNRKRPVKTRKA
ncbi:MAG: endonuclease III [Porticoccus sp.]|jgi:endonuclease-3|uniref:endonuclease III n=1 Tax=Porticoccus sp. TaxID=2024853 RepID=UPI003296E8B8